MRKLLFFMMGFLLLNILGVMNMSAQVALPYSINFGESHEGWTVIDNSAVTGITWTFKEKGAYNQGQYYPCVVINVDYNTNCDDYYISPAFNLKADTEYIINTITSGTTFDLDGIAVSLAIGTSSNDISTFTKIEDLNVPTSFQNTEAEKTKLIVETDGTYYIAFHSTTLRFNAETYLFGFSISDDEIENPDPDKPATLPYEINLKTSTEGWTPADNNGDGITWTSYPDYGVAMEMAFSSDHNDDFISPAFTLKGGMRYKITTIVSPDGQPSSSDQISIMVGKEKSEDAFNEIGKLTISKFGENNEESYFTPKEDGTYYFAFRNLSKAFGNTLLLYHFGIEGVNINPDQEIPIFSTDFSGQNPIKGWTILDSNSDKITWQALSELEGITYDSNNASGAADDWLITPGLSLTVGQDYLVRFTIAQSGAFDADNVEVKWGEMATIDGLTKLLSTESIDLGNGEMSKTYRFSCEHTGNAYIGFHINTQDVNGTLSLTNIEIVGVVKAIPLPVENLQVSSDFKDKSVTLEWINPSYDTKQSPIVSPLNIKIYENESLIETLSNDIIAGELREYIYKPSIPFMGEAVYKVTAMIGDNESDPVSKTISLDDMQGDTILVESFSLKDKEAFGKWVVENKNGGKTWTYEAWDEKVSIPMMSMDNDDWLVTPGVTLTTDKRYVVQYKLSTSSIYGGSLDVTIGNAQNADGQTTILTSHDDLKQNGYAEFATRQFSIEADGNYYIGFHAGEVGNGMSLKNVTISYIGEKGEIVPVLNLPYSQNFDESIEIPIGWKAMGNTGPYGFSVVDVEDYLGLPNVQAHTLPNAMYAAGGATLPRTEFIYTPKFALKQGVEYAVQFWLQMPEQNGKKNSLNVYVATDHNEENIIGNSLYEVKDGSISEWIKQYFIFIPESDGEYCFAIKVTCPLTNAGYIMIDDFSIEQNVSVAVPAAPTNLGGSKSVLDLSIIMNWNNPTLDMDGNKLLSGTEVRTQLFENENLLGETVGQVGELVTFVHKYSSEDFKGQKIIKAVSYIQDLKGGANTCVVDISSSMDGMLKVTTFQSDFDNSGKWTIIDNDKDGKKWMIDQTEKIASTEGRDDWLISPVVKLDEGKTYLILCEIQTNENEGAKVEFTRGNSQNVKEQTINVALYEKLTLGNYGLLEIGVPFIAEKENNYFGIHVADNTGKVSIKSFELIRVFDSSEPEELPYTEDFEDRNNIDERTNFINKWGCKAGSANIFKISKMPENTIPAHSGKYAAVAEASTQGKRFEILYTPMFDFEQGKSYLIKYHLYMPGNEGRNTKAFVFASPTQDSPIANLEELHKIEVPVSQWTEYSFTCTAQYNLPYCFYFYFEAAEANAGIIAFDDFSIEETIISGINRAVNQSDMWYVASTSTLVVPQGFNLLTIYDAQGRLISNLHIDSGNVNLSMLDRGLYYVQAQNSEGKIFSIKIMK